MTEPRLHYEHGYAFYVLLCTHIALGKRLLGLLSDWPESDRTYCRLKGLTYTSPRLLKLGFGLRLLWGLIVPTVYNS